MKKKAKSIVLFIALLAIAYALIRIGFDTRFHLKQIKRFSEYESSCEKISEYILSQGEGDYHIQYNTDSNKYILSKRSGRHWDDPYIDIDMPDELQPLIPDLYHGFYEMTHEYGVDWIDVENESVIYWEMNYGGKLIYTKDGQVDERHKSNADYREYYKINDNWYAVFISLI